MDPTYKIIFSVAAEILFLYCFITTLLGLLRLRRSGAVVLAEKSVWFRLYTLLALSALLQVGFFLTLTGPNYYLLAMVSGFAALYASVMSGEALFAYEEKTIWFGFHSYPRGSVTPGASQQRRRALNVLMETREKKQFVLRTTPTLWEEIQKHL